MAGTTTGREPGAPSHFIRTIIEDDLRTGKHAGRVLTRFPPEPNGYLHIGHAKSICLNFGLAREYGGRCNLRFDDTNPTKEDVEYVESIMEDVRWLGFDWEDRLFYASDYFERLYECAVQLIKDGKAYVDSLSADEIREHRGTLTEPGRASPYRARSVEENLDLFARMRAGDFADGTHVLRAKIDMASPNLNMRDPSIYRIRHASHHRTGDRWCIYPLYDFTHCLSDSFEGITHSICTLEFENHRPLYDWVLDELRTDCHPQQIEFARLNLTYTVLSKRKLLELVGEGHVSGWDDPRMPTISGLRRRGYTPEAIRDFCERIGVAKRDSIVDVAMLEHSIRDDFREDPPRKFFRLAPGREVRLRYAYYVTCVGVVKDAAGEVVELRCTYDPATRGGGSPDGRKVKATLHWVSARHAVDAEVRLYDRLFLREDPEGEKGTDYRTFLNPDSLQALRGCKLEPSLADARPGDRFQFERQGYFCADSVDSRAGAPVFNRTVPLRDTWAKIEQADEARGGA